MTLGELESIALRIPVLEERLTSLEAKLEEMVAKPTIPEFVSRPELARISGISQNTIRRREYQAELPNRGRFDTTLRGVRVWRRETVEQWIKQER